MSDVIQIVGTDGKANHYEEPDWELASNYSAIFLTQASTGVVISRPWHTIQSITTTPKS